MKYLVFSTKAAAPLMALALVAQVHASPSPAAIGTTNATALASAKDNIFPGPQPASSGQTLEPGAKVSFTLAEDPRAGTVPLELTVDPRSYLHFPVSRGFDETVDILVENKTCLQVQKELKEKLDGNYYKNATVVITPGPQPLLPGKIILTGPVRANFVPIIPGEHKNLLEVILTAGPSEFANLKKVKIMRTDPVTGKTEEKIYDVEDIKKHPTKDVPVRDGDRIDIREKNILFQ